MEKGDTREASIEGPSTWLKLNVVRGGSWWRWGQGRRGGIQQQAADCAVGGWRSGARRIKVGHPLQGTWSEVPTPCASTTECSRCSRSSFLVVIREASISTWWTRTPTRSTRQPATPHVPMNQVTRCRPRHCCLTFSLVLYREGSNSKRSQGSFKTPLTQAKPGMSRQMFLAQNLEAAVANVLISEMPLHSPPCLAPPDARHLIRHRHGVWWRIAILIRVFLQKLPRRASLQGELFQGTGRWLNFKSIGLRRSAAGGGVSRRVDEQAFQEGLERAGHAGGGAAVP